MSRADFILSDGRSREEAKRAIDGAPRFSHVNIKVNKRTIPQNARLHAMLTQLAKQVEWHGHRLPVDDWKLIFMDALDREVRTVPSLDNRGFVNLGRSTSKLTVEECGDMMILVEKFAAERDIDLKEPTEGKHNDTERSTPAH